MIQTYTYEIIIDQPVEAVYQRFIQASEYPKWSKAWGPHQQMIGSWENGSTVTFIDHEHGGAKVLVEDIKPYSHIKTKHIAMTTKDHQEIEHMDEVMKVWIGTLEEYYFSSAEALPL